MVTGMGSPCSASFLSPTTTLALFFSFSALYSTGRMTDNSKCYRSPFPPPCLWCFSKSNVGLQSIASKEWILSHPLFFFSLILASFLSPNRGPLVLQPRYATFSHSIRLSPLFLPPSCRTKSGGVLSLFEGQCLSLADSLLSQGGTLVNVTPGVCPSLTKPLHGWGQIFFLCTLVPEVGYPLKCMGVDGLPLFSCPFSSLLAMPLCRTVIDFPRFHGLPWLYRLYF